MKTRGHSLCAPGGGGVGAGSCCRQNCSDILQESGKLVRPCLRLIVRCSQMEILTEKLVSTNSSLRPRIHGCWYWGWVSDTKHRKDPETSQIMTPEFSGYVSSRTWAVIALHK